MDRFGRLRYQSRAAGDDRRGHGLQVPTATNSVQAAMAVQGLVALQEAIRTVNGCFSVSGMDGVGEAIRELIDPEFVGAFVPEPSR
jgi:hypothetical protein